MNLRNIEFFIQEAFTGIVRNGVMAVASISTIALSLGVLGAFVLLSLGANNFASAQIGQFKIAVFVLNSEGANVDSIASHIREMPGVESVIVKDRHQQWSQFKRERPDLDPAGLPVNPLPYSLEVTVSDHSKEGEIADSIRTIDGVDRVRDSRESLSRVMALAQVTKAVSIVGMLILLVTTVFIISNAIRLTLYARRREIRIMQLVGATNWTIRIPLVIEGMAFGAVGAVSAWLLLLVGTTYMSHVAHRILPMLYQFSTHMGPVQLAEGLLLMGVAIGAAGSFVSIHRFLHD